MREIASCLSDHSVRVSDYSCSNAANLSCHAPRLAPSIQNAVICTYISKLSNQKQLLIRLNWSKNAFDQGLCISEIEADDPSSVSKLTTQNRLFKKKKGHKLLEFDSLKVEIFWDLSSAKYFNSGPEPINGFFFAVLIDSEMGLLLGDMGDDLIHKKLKTEVQFAQFTLISRREHFNGGTLYSTKAQFSQIGAAHDIAIRCSGEDEGLKYPALSISIDKRRVILVKRLHWNFRGNQTIFIDGLTVDLMWDVYDWLFDRANGYASFMFRTRSVLDSRLWLEEKSLVLQEQQRIEFSLFICACKS